MIQIFSRLNKPHPAPSETLARLLVHKINFNSCTFLLCLGIILAIGLPSPLVAADNPSLFFSWPIDCIPGMNCAGRHFRIGYPDLTGTGRSFSCGQPGYTGHQGTDIIVSSIEQDVTVLAAAEGVVRWTRDGLFDRCPDANRECAAELTTHLPVEGKQAATLGFNAGNFIVVEHNFGLSRYLTLYAHLRSGSQLVKTGDHIARGTRIGKVGSSGNSMIPHLHFGVFRSVSGYFQPVDPWNGPCNSSSSGLWDSDPPYQPLIDKILFQKDSTVEDNSQLP
ncbi:M23 family metallopeptidase [Pelotalea chapellei]|uniref:M23 family metallopeptidase n=1 Tax=Pelotalea chapellei TaxID=44671 RepID=A0ABS5U9J6_9BACT|nr:M23 family metallopeptidase [Pelotalea chapellei]MBT1072362.1 M23 family metallopeptidase [Pelotalea chapellei]